MFSNHPSNPVPITMMPSIRSRFEAEGNDLAPTCNENSRRSCRRIIDKKSIAKTLLTGIGSSPDFFPEKEPDQDEMEPNIVKAYEI
jgi:hypothetical protein